MVCINPIRDVSSIEEIKEVFQGQAVYRRPSMDSSPTSHVVEMSTTRREMPFISAPMLTPPKKVQFKETDFIHVLDQIHSTGSSLVDSFTKNISEGSRRLRELSRENIDKLKEAAQRAKDSGFWSFLQKIGEFILAAISTVLGISLIASGAAVAVGSVLIASSILSVANFAMKETGAWDSVAKKLASKKEDQQKLSQYLPMAISLISAVLSLGGTAASALWTTMNLTQKALSIAQATMAIYQGAVTAGKGLAEARVLWTEADLAEIQSKTALERIAFEAGSEILQTIQKILRQIQESSEQVIDLAAAAYRNIRIQA